MKKLLFACLTAGLILGGCAKTWHIGEAQHTLGRDFSNSGVSQIEQGVTTMDEIKRLFGQPHAIRVKPDSITWLYNYIPTSVKVDSRRFYRKVDVNTKTNMKILKVTFKEGVVNEYFYTTYYDDELGSEVISMIDEDLAEPFSEENPLLY